MLEIKNITKDYDTGTDEKVHAARGVPSISVIASLWRFSVTRAAEKPHC